MAVVMTLADIRMLPGCAADLAEPTAVVDIDWQGDGAGDVVPGIRHGLSELFVGQPFFGIGESDWPEAFLVDAANRRPGQPGALAEWLVAVTVALQRLAHDPVWAGRVLTADHRRLRLAMPWQRASVLRWALDFAMRLLGAWTEPMPDREALRQLLGELFEELPDIRIGGLDEDELRYVQAAVERDIPFAVVPGAVQLGWGAAADFMNRSRSKHSAAVSVHIANNKLLCNQIMTAARIPVAPGEVVCDVDGAVRVAGELGWPVVVKPLALNRGGGVMVGIRDTHTLRRAFDAAERLSPGFAVVEKHIDGDDHRLLFVRGRFLTAARRHPPVVVGDGSRSIRSLIDQLNGDPWRQPAIYRRLAKVVADEETTRCLAEQDLTLDSVLEPDRRVVVRQTASVSTGATAELVTEIHPANVALAERAVRLVGLDIAAVDILTADITRSWRDVGAVVCEIDAQPGLGVQWPVEPDRDISGDVIDVLFEGRSGRIPVAAVTGGGAGTSKTALVLQHIWATAGRTVGLCGTDILMIGDDVVSTTNMAGQPGGRILLTDPAVQVVVLELPASSVAEFGHPCDRYGVSAVLSADGGHPQQVTEMVQRARDAVVINADDPDCVAQGALSSVARRILVSADPRSTVVAEHRSRGGEVVLPGGGDDGRSWFVVDATNTGIPLVSHRVAGAESLVPAVFAAAVAWAQGLDPALIREALARLPISVASASGFAK